MLLLRLGCGVVSSGRVGCPVVGRLGGFFDWSRQQSIVDPEGIYTSATGEADRVLYTLFLH